MIEIPANFTPFKIAQPLLAWFDNHGRHDLPWQFLQDIHQNPANIRDSLIVDMPSLAIDALDNRQVYWVWVSEIMLQQTQVKTVLQYFLPFVQRFASITQLAHATWDEVAPYWAGLGYYARARNLHKAAQTVVAQGMLPKTLAGWVALSGIGRSTAGAIMALGQGQYGVILDGNVKRVLSRFTANNSDLTKPKALEALWYLATEQTPQERYANYAQAMMDLGATVCTNKKPSCLKCPLNTQCQAYLHHQPSDFPAKVVRKALPHKYAQVLLIRQDSHWLWQQRPASGLWGGLWALPILEDAQNVHNVMLSAPLAAWLNTQTAKPMCEVKHTFTHFVWHLQVMVYALQSIQELQISPSDSVRWMLPSEAIQAGIPTAMIKVIQCVAKMEASII